MNAWQVGVGISTAMTTATTMAGERVVGVQRDREVIVGVMAVGEKGEAKEEGGREGEGRRKPNT